MEKPHEQNTEIEDAVTNKEADIIPIGSAESIVARNIIEKIARKRGISPDSELARSMLRHPAFTTMEPEDTEEDDV